MPKRTTKNTDKWIAEIHDEDIFICCIPMRETTKQLRHAPEAPGEGKCTATGFNGTKTTHTWLLGWNTVFDKNDKRFFDTYEEARESLRAKLDERKLRAIREAGKAQDLVDLFESVPYIKKESK